MKLLVINEASGNNLGDRAIFHGLLNVLKSHHVTVLPLGYAAEHHSIGTPNPVGKLRPIRVRFINFIKQHRLMYFLFNFLRAILFNSRRAPSLKRSISESDVVIIGGGSLLINNAYTFPVSLFFVAILCKIARKQYGFAGISYRGTKSALVNAIFSYVLKGSSFVYFRDYESLNNVREDFSFEGQFCPDFALALKRLNVHSSALESSNIALVNIMGRQTHGFFSWEKNFSDYLTFTASLIRGLLDAGKDVVLFTTGENSDLVGVDLLKDEISNESISICHPRTLTDLLCLYDSSDVVYGTRLHSAIIGFALGKFVTCFNWDNKVRAFFETVGCGNGVYSIVDSPIDILDRPMCSDIEIDRAYSSFLRELEDIAK